LTRRSLGCLAQDKRSSLEAAAEIRTCGLPETDGARGDVTGDEIFQVLEIEL
jgi:hypothetical protein